MAPEVKGMLGSKGVPALVAAGLAWIAYLILFYRQPLESLGQKPETGLPWQRWELVLWGLFPAEFMEQWLGPGGQWGILDRIPVLLTALVILTIAWAAGESALAWRGISSGLSRLERFVFATAVGLNIVSLFVLGLGLCGLVRQRWLFLALGAMLLTLSGRAAWRRRRRAELEEPPAADEPTLSRHWLWLGLPFALVLLFGGMLPPVDFDVREYHLQVPKEFYLAGRIQFLPHNVYGNMPLGAEMYALLSMTLMDSWWDGALAGKTIIAAFALLTALGLYAAGRRLVSPAAGGVAALLYVSIPWVLRVSTSGLIDGAFGFYLFMAWYAVVLWQREAEGEGQSQRGSGRLLLAGFLAGAAVACKYPALLFVVLPLTGWILFFNFVARPSRPCDDPVGQDAHAINKSANLRAAVLFLAAVAAGCGLWLGKNWVLTGNPTYPLLYEVFGGESRTPELNRQWTSAHRPHDFQPGDLAQRLAKFAYASDWQSPLLIPLAALALAVRKHRKLVFALLGYLGFVLASWWLLTHRIDRFWVPALPLLALLGGIGATWNTSGVWRGMLLGGLAIGLATNFLFATIGGAGCDNRYLARLSDLRIDPVRTNPWHRWLNHSSTPTTKVLTVGDAQVFDLEMPVLYSTVFDACLLEQLAQDRTPTQLRAELHRLGVTHVYVDWRDIDRYRSPGNYGFTPYITRDLFSHLVTAGVLLSPAQRSDHPGEVYGVRP